MERLFGRALQILHERYGPGGDTGRVPLVLHLLAPNHRPQQVTDDLASFWASAYQEVRKELRGRYPKHHWPEDPLSAPPTAKTKRRTS